MDPAPPSTPAGPDRGQRLVRRTALAFWAVALTGYLIALGTGGLGPLDLITATIAFVADHPLGPLIYLLAYAVRPLALLSAALLTVAAGLLYGPLLGTVLAVVAANLSALVAYGLGRALGSELGAATPGPAWQERWVGRMRSRTFETVLTLRFLFLPYDAVTYLAGALRLALAPFLIATAIGSLPGTVTFVLFGAGLGDLSELAAGRLPSLDPRLLGVSAGLFLASLAAARWLRRREARA